MNDAVDYRNSDAAEHTANNRSLDIQRRQMKRAPHRNARKLSANFTTRKRTVLGREKHHEQQKRPQVLPS